MNLEKEIATHSSTLAWKIPRMMEPGRLQSMGSQRVIHNWATSLQSLHTLSLEKEMATHSSVLAWRIPWTEKPGRLQSMGSHRVGHDWSDLAAAYYLRVYSLSQRPVILSSAMKEEFPLHPKISMFPDWSKSYLSHDNILCG